MGEGDLAGAEDLCRRLISDQADNAQAHNILGGIALKRGDASAAADHFRAAVALDPGQGSYQQGLGIAEFSRGRMAEALKCFEHAVQLDGRSAAAHCNLGNACRETGRTAVAARCYRRSIRLDPGYLPAYLNLADLRIRQGRHKAAAAIFRKALARTARGAAPSSDRALLCHRLGLALRELGRTDAAIAQYRRAIEFDPAFALAHNSLGGALLARNELDAALASFRRALELEPGYSRVHSNILLTMNYQSGVSQADIYQESLRFDALHARPLLDPRPLRNARNRKRRLKIGYLSPDFREHSVAQFTLKLFARHNRESFEVFGYSDVAAPDRVTAQFSRLADQWLDCAAAPDADLAERIRRDGIDILVDLAGHTGNNRLLVFARRPAPVQVSWLGYPNTTGLQAMDYRLTDAVADPPGEADDYHTEKLVRMKHGFLCYQPEDTGLAVAEPPSVRRGYVTFGSFNMIRKITPEVLDVWSRILLAVPRSRLLVKSYALQDAGTRSRMLAELAGRGVRAKRVQLLNAVPGKKDHLGLYSRVDIALDTFPYNGTTTTLEALWMGVPVICLLGDRHSGRVGASILERLQLGDLLCRDRQEYVERAASLAGDAAQLMALRTSLRPRLQASPLMDVRDFTRTLEAEYRKFWVAWCAGRRS